MTTVQQIVNDVNSVYTDSKKKNQQLRLACELAITELRNYNSLDLITTIREQKIQKDILSPFLIALGTNNVKLVSYSVPVIHQLIVNGIFPAASLSDLLSAFKESSKLNVDIQLRILQCLPVLIQKLGQDIYGDLLIQILEICSILTSSGKSTAISNTASATMQQIFNDVYETRKPLETNNQKILLDNEQTLNIDEVSYEEYKIFESLCQILANESPYYFNEKVTIKDHSTLEIIEAIISNHKEIFAERKEMNYLVRVKLVPTLLGILNSSPKKFPLFIRSMRIINILLTSLLPHMEIEGEIILSFINHQLLRDEDSQEKSSWERITYLETYKNIFSDFNALRMIYETYDLKDGKKNAIKEIFSVLSSLLEKSSLFILNSLVLPSSSLEEYATVNHYLFLSRQNIHLRVRTLDNLEKSAPPSIPLQLHYIYLIFQILCSASEGIVHFVSGLENSSTKELEKHMTFVHSIIETTFKDIVHMFHAFLYCLIDSENFHQILRTLQKFIHTVGLLGLDNCRDELLTLLSAAISQNVISEKLNYDMKKSLGEDLSYQGQTFQDVAADNGSIRSQEIQASDFELRSFNSRNAMCLRALVNLASSLNATLGNSWLIVLVSIQWTDFFMNGADNSNNFIGNKSKKGSEGSTMKINPQDMNSIKSSTSKFLEGVKEYEPASFHYLANALLSLTEAAFSEHDGTAFSKGCSICPFNKTFFMGCLVNICSINPVKFLIQTNESWNSISDFLIRLSTNRSHNYGLKTFIMKQYGQIIQSMAEEGFKSEKADIESKTSEKCLQGLTEYLQKLFELGMPLELLMLNCETELHLYILDTLHDLIDNFDTHFQNSWQEVFKILNTSFRINSENESDNNLREKKTLVMSSSFNTLKLILDEFLSTIPYDQLRMLIDMLFNFSLQTFDLNISFSAVSYFWLVSDTIKSRFVVTEGTGIIEDCHSQSELLTYLGSCKEDSKTFYVMIDVYLMLTLSKLSKDPRARVRDGAIQTFFQIIEIHGSLLKCWKLILEIVLPNLFDTPLTHNGNDPTIAKEVIESLGLILFGLVSLSQKLLYECGSDDTTRMKGVIKLWSYNVDFLEKLRLLKWDELNLKCFKAFHDLVVPLSNVSTQYQDSVRNLLFNFWVNVPIEYDFFNPIAQDCLVQLMKSFPQLYSIIKHTLSVKEMDKSLSMFNKCARYPVLPRGKDDNNKPTELQAAVIENLKCIDLLTFEFNSRLIQQLSNILVYPFGTRSRIEEKLGARLQEKVKVPTFVAVSALSEVILAKRLEEIEDFEEYLKDKSLHRVIKALLEVIQNNSKGTSSMNIPLFLECERLFTLIVKKVFETNMEFLQEKEESQDLWILLVDGMKCLIDKNRDIAFEDANLELYFEVRSIILPALASKELNQELLQDFVSFISENSFLYEFDDIEISLKASSSSAEDFGKLLVDFDYEKVFGLTDTINVYPNRRTRLCCLKELIYLSVNSDFTQSHLLGLLSLDHFILRSVYALKRFIAEEKLLRAEPLPKIQQLELNIILSGVLEIQHNLSNTHDFSRLQDVHLMLTKVIFSSRRMPELQLKISRAVQNFCPNPLLV